MAKRKSPTRPAARPRNNGRAPLEHPPAVPSGVLAEAAAHMLKVIDQERAQCVVQRTANGHVATDVYRVEQTPAGMVRITYAEKLAELDKAEQRLSSGLEPGVLEQAQQLAGRD